MIPPINARFGVLHPPSQYRLKQIQLDASQSPLENGIKPLDERGKRLSLEINKELPKSDPEVMALSKGILQAAGKADLPTLKSLYAALSAMTYHPPREVQTLIEKLMLQKRLAEPESAGTAWTPETFDKKSK